MYQLTDSPSLVVRIEDGAQIPLPPNESEGFAYQQWLDEGNAPLPAPVPSLGDQQAQMWENIKAKRDELRFDGGVEVGANWFLSTAQAVSEYTALSIIGAGAPGSTVLRAGWRTMVDGVTVDMTPDLVKQILSAGFTQVAAIDDASLKHKAAMEAAPDPMVYDFSGGWPATFPK